MYEALLGIKLNLLWYSQMRFSYQLIVDFIRRHKNTFLLIIVVALITALLQTLISVWLSRNNKISLPSFGTIYTLQAEVYGGSLKELSNGQKLIDWGTVYPGTTVNRTFNVMSKSNVNAVDFQLSHRIIKGDIFQNSKCKPG